MGAKINIGIIWSEGISTETLDFYLFNSRNKHEHLKNYFSEYKLVLIKPTQLLEESGEIEKKFLNDFQSIFILAELKWHNEILSNFYGIEIAQKLRLSDFIAPIFICSFVPEEYLVKKRNYLILKSIGHYFIHLPTGLSMDWEIRVLDQMELVDIQSHYCDSAGIIKTIWHKKQEAIIMNFLEGKNFIKGLLDDIRNISNLPEPIYSETEKLERELNEVDEVSFSTFLDERTDRIFLSHLEDITDQPVYSYKKGWEVLILEDKPNQVKKLKEKLEKINDSLKVHLATSYIEAIKIISKDIFNKITIAIVDYRLEDSQGNSKEKQGYSFISWLLKENRFTDIFVYSGQSRTTVLNTFQSFGIKPSYKRKTEVIGKVLNDFIEEIVEKGNMMYSALLNQPRSGIWNHSLRVFYAHYRNHEDYILFESQISLEAKRYIKQLDYFLTLSVTAAENGWFNRLLREGILIPPFKGVRKGQLRDNKGKLPPKPKPFGEYDEFFETFKIWLIIRRIVLWLKNQNGINDWKTIASLIFEGTFQTEKPDDKALMTYTCLSDDDYPSRILVEEKHWFQSIIHDYEDPESINDKEKIVYFDESINIMDTFLNDNMELIRTNQELHKAIQPFIIISRLIRIKTKDKTFYRLNEVFGLEFLEFLNYLLNYNPSLQEVDIFKPYIKDGSVKKTALSKLPALVKVLDERIDKLDYLTPLKFFFSKDRIELSEKIQDIFLIEFKINCLHPFELIEFVKLMRSSKEFINNSILPKIGEELSKYIDTDHYHGQN